jgi:16S rRNA (uracil1498-N3)-methyltransferase
MNHFYFPEQYNTDQILTLSPEESHHATKVLRLTIGQPVSLINGMGQRAQGLLHVLDGKQVKVLVCSVENHHALSGRVSIALALLKKKERLEWFIEKAVELGAAEIIIFNSDHTEKKKVDGNRLQKIALSALKQSGNLWMPEIKTSLTFAQLINEPWSGQKFIAHCEDSDKLLLKNACKKNENALILIGPEGDFSPNEIATALKNNFIPVSLGDLRLRAETAAITALITIQVNNQ